MSGLRVLSIDDDEDALNIVEAALSAYGADVKTATCQAEAIALLMSYRPDVLICDIGMPAVDGYTLLKRIRALPAEQHRYTPAIALTAYARDEDREKALGAGFQVHLTKPVDILEVAQAVAAIAV